MVHVSGIGLGYRNGKHKTGYKKRMLEIEFTNMRHPKEVKTANPYYEKAKSYVYGNLNNLFLLRAGLGKQKIINSKPYWGGIELRFSYYGGLSLGLLKPTYLYILHESGIPYNYKLVVEKYNPEKHFSENIFGKAPFFEGIERSSFMPGLYAKIALNFEYGAYDRSLKALETGITVDAFQKPVPIMAFNKNKNVFLSLYISLHFGKRGS